MSEPTPAAKRSRCSHPPCNYPPGRPRTFCRTHADELAEANPINLVETILQGRSVRADLRPLSEPTPSGRAMPAKFLPLRATPTTTGVTSPGDAVRAAAQWLEDALAGYSTGSAALGSPYVQAGRDIIAQLRDYASRQDEPSLPPANTTGDADA